MQIIDLRGDSYPTNFIKAKSALEMIDSGVTVEFLLDDGEPLKNVPRSLKADGHKLLGLRKNEGYYSLIIETSFPGMGPNKQVREYAATKITRNSREPATDPVMVEETIELIVNGKKLPSIVTTPDLHKELAVGYMVTEGAIKNSHDIEEVIENDNGVMLTIKSFAHFNHWYELRSSGYIGLNWDKRDEDVYLPVSQTFRIDVLLDSMKYLYDETQDRTGGAHSASLVDSDGNLRYKALDIGRHNAVDKVVGTAVLNGDDLTKLFLVSSGRQPAGMVMKASRAGIPLVITKSAPISSGIDNALRTNITLCCFANMEKVKVFSAPERIT